MASVATNWDQYIICLYMFYTQWFSIPSPPPKMYRNGSRWTKMADGFVFPSLSAIFRHEISVFLKMGDDWTNGVQYLLKIWYILMVQFWMIWEYPNFKKPTTWDDGGPRWLSNHRRVATRCVAAFRIILRGWVGRGCPPPCLSYWHLILAQGRVA